MLASAGLTGDAFELFQEERPVTGGPPPHVHRERDEAFFVLEGRYRFVRDHEEVELLPGGFIYIPRGTRHGYRTLVAPARTLILLVPAGLEGFFREMGTHLAAGSSALDAMTALAGRYDAHPVD
jgi:quercetin dioxygenase-like cupin family protein